MVMFCLRHNFIKVLLYKNEIILQGHINNNSLVQRFRNFRCTNQLSFFSKKSTLHKHQLIRERKHLTKMIIPQGIVKHLKSLLKLIITWKNNKTKQTKQTKPEFRGILIDFHYINFIIFGGGYKISQKDAYRTRPNYDLNTRLEYFLMK